MAGQADCVRAWLTDTDLAALRPGEAADGLIHLLAPALFPHKAAPDNAGDEAGGQPSGVPSRGPAVAESSSD